MGPFSHYVLANKLEPSLLPEDRKAYYWGAVVPDIRYLAQMRRERTHLGQDRIQEFISCYPDLRSFLTGYLVHILIDQVDFSHIVGEVFPLNIIKKVMRKSISPAQMTMLVEMFYLQSGTAQEPLSGEHNKVLADLGITAEQTAQFYQALQEYFKTRSLEAAISAFQKIGMIENSRLEKYLNSYRAMQKRKIITTLILLSVKNARLDDQVIKHVQSHMAGLD